MPKPNRPTAYQPSFVPAFQPNSDGIMVNNSAQSFMHYGFQKLLMEQGSVKKRADETVHMSRRQKRVDEYNKVCNGPDIVRTEKFVYTLPTIASPQLVFSGVYDKKNVSANRAKQEADFAGSFLSKDKATWQRVYREIDDAMKAAEERKNSLTFFQKLLWSPVQKSHFFYEPLRDAVKYLDSHYEKQNKPLRLKWREIQLEPGKNRVDLFFVFPNINSQYEHGFHTWMGSENVLERI